jgi:hypothetical protein
MRIWILTVGRIVVFTWDGNGHERSGQQIVHPPQIVLNCWNRCRSSPHVFVCRIRVPSRFLRCRPTT